MVDDPLLGRQLANFRLERAIGRGGMAQVYYGQDVKLHRPVAIKVIDARYRSDPDYAKRFVREAQTIARWRHEHIIQIHYADDEDGLYYFVMEYIDGVDLGEFITQFRAKGEQIPHSEVMRIGRAVAGALDYAHRRGVIHRDVKPSNVLVAHDDRIVLADFGLALEVEQGSLGEVFGSANYIAPEQARNSAEAVPQSDLYALGVILYEMLTGRVPFNDPSATTVAVQHVTLPPPAPRELNPNLSETTEQVLLKALSKSPQTRYQTGRSLMDALAKALTADATPEIAKTKVMPQIAGPQPQAATLAPTGNRRLLYLGAALGIGSVIILLVLIAGVFWFLRSQNGEPAVGNQPPVAASAASATPTRAVETATATENPSPPHLPSSTGTSQSAAFTLPDSAVTPQFTVIPSATPTTAPPTVTPTATTSPTITPTATPAETPTPPATATPAPILPIADTQSGFSGSQGSGNWEYQWSQGRDSFDWAQMRFDGTCWRTTNTEDYVRICSGSAHPGLTGDIAWRWHSPVDGRVQVWVSAHKLDTGGGDGVIVLAYRNTTELKRWQLKAQDSQGFSESFGVDVAPEDFLFFVIKAGGDTMNDEIAFRAQVYGP